MIIKTDYFFKLLYAVSWIIFIGLCIEAGGFIFNTVFTLLLKPEGATKFWAEVNLSDLYHFNQSYYVTLTVLMIIAALLKALLFYIIVKIFHDKKINLSAPFNEILGSYIFKIAYLALGIGLFCYWGAKCTEWIVQKRVSLPGIQYLRLAGADVWLFMGVTLLVFAQIFKRGIDIQNENNLTV